MINNTISIIEKYDRYSSLKLELTDISNITNDFDMDDQNGNEFSFGKKVKIDIIDMDYKSWKKCSYKR